MTCRHLAFALAILALPAQPSCDPHGKLICVTVVRCDDGSPVTGARVRADAEYDETGFTDPSGEACLGAGPIRSGFTVEVDKPGYETKQTERLYVENVDVCLEEADSSEGTCTTGIAGAENTAEAGAANGGCGGS
jgi:hypothetical protein